MLLKVLTWLNLNFKPERFSFGKRRMHLLRCVFPQSNNVQRMRRHVPPAIRTGLGRTLLTKPLVSVPGLDLRALVSVTSAELVSVASQWTSSSLLPTQDGPHGMTSSHCTGVHRTHSMRLSYPLCWKCFQILSSPPGWVVALSIHFPTA